MDDRRIIISRPINAERTQNFDQFTVSVGIPTEYGVSLFAVCKDPEPDELVSDNDEIAEEKKKTFCRICLSSDRKLYAIPPQNQNTFKDVLNRENEGDNPIPQRVCFECNARMTSCTTFMTRALQTNSLLYAIIRPFANGYPDISHIDRVALQVASTLQTKVFEADHADYHYVFCHQTQVSLKTLPEFRTQIHAVDLPSLDLEDDDTLLFNSLDSSDDIIEENIKNKINIKKKHEQCKPENESCVSNTYISNYSSNDNFKGKLKKNYTTKVKKKITSNVTTEVKKKNKIVKNVDKRCKPASEVLDNDIFNIKDLNHEEQVCEINKRPFSSNYKNSVFKCSDCFKGFVDEDAFKGHIIRHTDQCGEFSCPICKLRFKKLQALRNHTTSHMQKFSCKQCSFVTFRRHAAKLHEEYHNGTKYVCPHCQENFDKLSTYMSHVRIKHPSDIVCQLCGYSFVSDKGLSLHKKLKHRFVDHQVPSDGPWCTKCDVQFISKEALGRHIQLSSKHSDEPKSSKPHARRNYRNQECSKIDNDTESKKKKNSNKSGAPIACEQCDQQLPDPLSYYRHFRRVHPDKNRTNYPSMKSKSMCEVCGKMFQSLALLQDHSWTHTDSKQFKCSSCDKTFVRKYRLIAHQRVHGATRDNHTCSVCGKNFTTASNMQRHMVSHTGLKPFKCEMCGKCFKHASEKRVHITYVHLKKPWPQRSRSRKKDKSTQPQTSTPASDVQPLQIGILVENKSMYYNNNMNS